MNNAILNFPVPANEPVKSYLEGSPERIALDAELERQWNTVVDIPIIIGGKEIRTGNVGTVVCPHDHKHVLATFHKVGEKEVEMAVEAAFMMGRYLVASSSAIFRTMAARVVQGVSDQILWASIAASIAIFTSFSPTLWNVARTCL